MDIVNFMWFLFGFTLALAAIFVGLVLAFLEEKNDD